MWASAASRPPRSERSDAGDQAIMWPSAASRPPRSERSDVGDQAMMWASAASRPPRSERSDAGDQATLWRAFPRRPQRSERSEARSVQDVTHTLLKVYAQECGLTKPRTFLLNAFGWSEWSTYIRATSSFRIFSIC